MSSRETTLRSLSLARLPWRQADMRLLVPVFAAIAAWLTLSAVLKAMIHGAPGASASLTPSYYNYAFRNALMFFQGALIIGAVRLALGLLKEGGLDGMKAALVGQKSRILALPLLFVAGLVSFALFMSAYSGIKVRIPSLHPFAWDDAFVAWDRALFFGHDPWAVFGFIYDSPFLLRSVDFLYDLWAVLLVGSWMVCFVMGNRADVARRLQYCLALILTWFVGGNLLAIFFSSAGPCFYDHVGVDPAYYSGLFDRLAATPGLRAPEMQQMLWQTFEQDGLGIGGISAAPSMHCATAFLFVLMFGRTPLRRTVTGVYFAVILSGSVILGWHYFIDGLMGAAIAFACWKLCGHFAARLAPAEGC
ncbi:MAG: phosphatase PAP2 family protein [Hyphomonas sp.]|uniref:phosphatase PAP2 family protein n=1 Tax=Hyphomonas sp. TaxID=87 RepID=UPI003527952A